MTDDTGPKRTWRYRLAAHLRGTGQFVTRCNVGAFLDAVDEFKGYASILIGWPHGVRGRRAGLTRRQCRRLAAQWYRAMYRAARKIEKELVYLR